MRDEFWAARISVAERPVQTTFTWSSDTPAIASIDQLGVLTALSEGTAILRGTASDGTTATLALPTRIAVARTTALYVGNAGFGEPADSDASDDFSVRSGRLSAQEAAPIRALLTRTIDSLSR